MIVEAILTWYSVSSEILMIKVGDGDPPVEPNAAGEACDKKEGKQQCPWEFNWLYEPRGCSRCKKPRETNYRH
jgi:hypothetical protein